VSSYTGTNQANENNDPGLQLAPEDDMGPDFGMLKLAFNNCVSDLQPYIEQCRENYETRYALWNGQSKDGRKHTREGSKIDPTPWDGASDLRVFLTDEAINAKVALQCMAFRKANLVAVPVEGNDLKRAKTVSGFMKWLVQTQIPEIDREVELLTNYLNEKGSGITGQFWETTQEKTLVYLTIEELQQQFPNSVIEDLIKDPITRSTLIQLMSEIYGCSSKKANKMMRELQRDRKTTVAMAGRVRSRPVIRAFSLDEDIFIPPHSTDLETASGIYRVQYFTAEQLRSFVNTDNWDSNWVESAIDKCRGQRLSIAPNDINRFGSRNMISTQDRVTDLIGVVYAYQRLSDSEGIPGIYMTIFNPELPPDIDHDGYAKYGLLGYAHGQYPFVLHRREHLSRHLHDSRGLPEPGKPIQDQIKVHKDSRCDAASLAILPPMGYPVGRPPGRWGAGARVPERRPGEYHFMDRPAPDGLTEASEKQLRDDFNQYNGFATSTSDKQFADYKNQFEVDKFMTGWSKSLRQIWSLYQQFGSEEIYFRVVGLRQADPIEFHKGEQDEDFDFVMNFQVDSMNADVTFSKLEQIAKIVATANKDGIVDYSEWLQVMIEAIDPTMAERILIPKETGQEKSVSEMQTLLAKVYSGQDHDIDPTTPPEIGLEVIKGYLEKDPKVKARMEDKTDLFGSRIQKIMKQLEFQITQRKNAEIGRMGA
jgi:hypothetical protein